VAYSSPFCDVQYSVLQKARSLFHGEFSE
jgi:hypothetical protein